MGLLLGAEHTGDFKPNPFTPHFGVTPSVLVGRDTDIRTVNRGLATGPTSRRFCSVLFGTRGSGKTTLLNHFEDITESAGWITLSTHAATPGVAERIITAIEQARDDYTDLPAAQPDSAERRTTRRAGLRSWPLSVTAEDIRSFKPRWDLRRHLTELGRIAQRRQTGVLITVDEMHAAPRDEMRAFAADIQLVTQRGQLPVAVIGAGIIDLLHAFESDEKLSFFLRGNQVHMKPLTVRHAREFYERTIADNGGRCTTEALEIMADNAGQYPVRMQALGEAAWEWADTHSCDIDVEAAAEGIRGADKFMAAQVHPQTWNDLGIAEHRCLAALADLGGAARRDEIVAATTGTVKNPRLTLERLESSECVTIDGYGFAELGPAITLDSVRRGARTLPPVPATTATAPGAKQADNSTPRPEQRQARNLAVGTCNEMMSRAQVRCALNKGHAGPHRSRK